MNGNGSSTSYEASVATLSGGPFVESTIASSGKVWQSKSIAEPNIAFPLILSRSAILVFFAGGLWLGKSQPAK